MNDMGDEFFTEAPPHRDEPSQEELEEQALSEQREHEKTMGHYYKGIWQGLVLGIFGNLLVSFFVELLRELIPQKWWFITNTVGLLAVTAITGLVVWKMFVTAETYLQGKFYTDQLKKDIKERVKSIIKLVIIFAMIFLVFYGLKMFNVVADTVLPTYNITLELGITERVSIDFFGGILPTLISFVFLFYLIYLENLRVKSYLQDFVILFLLTVPCSYLSSSLDSLKVNYIWVSFIVSLFAVFRTYDKGLITYVKTSIKNRELKKLAIKWKDYISSILLAFSYASLAVLTLDLIYVALVHSVSSEITMYIGAKGIVDGIVLAPLSSLFFVSLFTLVLILIKTLLSLFRKQHSSSYSAC